MTKIDPLTLLENLLVAGYEVFYADADPVRLQKAELFGAHRVIDVRQVNGASTHHPQILIVVHCDGWHAFNHQEYKMWPGRCMIEVGMWP